MNAGQTVGSEGRPPEIGPLNGLDQEDTDSTESESEEDEELLQTVAKLKFPPDQFLLIDGGTPHQEHVHIAEYLGEEWDELIWKLHNEPPMAKPEDFIRDPHHWQLKGAAQMHMLCCSQFRGGICGDEMGTGKTIMAILAMHLALDEPGYFSLVVCPKSCQRQWVAEIEACYEVIHQSKVLVLEDSAMTAHELLAGGWDIVIASYEYVEFNHRGVRDFPSQVAEYQAGNVNIPKRPTSALFSSIHKILNMPIKRLILDECQRVKNTKGARHIAAKRHFLLFLHYAVRHIPR